MKFFQSLKAHLLKVTLTIAATLLIVKYWRQVGLDSRHFEPLFRMKILETENVTVLSGTDVLEEFNSSSSHNSSETTNSSYTQDTTLCPPVPSNLSGPINVIRTRKDFSDLEKLFPELKPGGMFAPKECKARYVVALVIPYRDRPEQLSIFLNNMHRLLMKQQIDYGIFIIEQQGNDPFNRGKLMNVGFAEASKVKNFDCYIFHDVDLIPEDDRNLYTCPEQPRHMSVAVDKFRYSGCSISEHNLHIRLVKKRWLARNTGHVFRVGRMTCLHLAPRSNPVISPVFIVDNNVFTCGRLPYKEIFGGVCALSKEHFILTNGFSNLFWGWGGEDDDMYSRVRRKGLHVSRYPAPIARYIMLPHDKQTPNPMRFQIIQQGKKLYEKDGLSNLDYTIITTEFRRLYTWILVDIHPPR